MLPPKIEVLGVTRAEFNQHTAQPIWQCGRVCVCAPVFLRGQVSYKLTIFVFLVTHFSYWYQ